MKYTADFETATWLEDSSYVWAWAICEIGNEDNILLGNSMESFIEFIKTNKNSTYFFHNLAFDGSFVIDYLFKKDFTFIKDKKERKNNTFTTLISDNGLFYSIEIYFEVKGKKVKKATLIDSLKIIPFKVSEVAKAFGLPISKLELDYNKPREIGHILTKDEEEYIKNDVKIVAMALNTLFSEGLTSITSASNALKDFKSFYSENKFSKLFPCLPLEIDKDLRDHGAYKGGLFPQTIKEEVDDLVKAIDKKLKQEFKNHAGDVEWFYKQGHISASTYDMYKRGIYKAESVIPKYSKAKAYSALQREIKAYNNPYAIADLSDILEGATGAKVQCGWGHGAKYWKDRTIGGISDGLATEAFAEMTDSTFANPESLELIKKYLPKSYKIYEEMLEVLVNG